MLVEIFSKRKKKTQGKMPDVYQCETIPQELRIQIFHIFRDIKEVSNWDYLDAFEDACSYTRTALLHEYGLLFLESNQYSVEQDIFAYLLDMETETEKILDIVELFLSRLQRRKSHDSLTNQMITELNTRFRERGVGYGYESGQIIQIKSQVIHSQVVQPALKMLTAHMYKGANQEYLNAHKHYRAGRYKECLSDCLKSIESCIKAICDKKGWRYNEQKDTADSLIEIVFKEGLLPDFMQSHFSGLRAALKSGVPTIRNRRSGHGQGASVVNVPEHIAAYALHLTAANILLLAKAAE